MEINTRATPIGPVRPFAVARSCRAVEEMQRCRDSDDRDGGRQNIEGWGGEGNGCDPSDSPSALARPLEPLGGLAMERGKGRRPGTVPGTHERVST